MDGINFKNYGLDDKLLEAIRKLGYDNPTKVQEKVIPLVLEGTDIIVKSQTGSGKTASFGIPVCEKIDIEKVEPQAMILEPTRELCVQIKEDITNIGRMKKVRCAAIFGKQPVNMQVRELKQRVHIIAGTPGRTIDLIERGSIILEKIKYLIIDEADKMMSMGFIDQIESIISKLPKDRVTMLFSATMPEEIEKLCKRYMKMPVRIEITPQSITADNIQQGYCEIEKFEKYNSLEKLIYVNNPESCIIFCRTKDNVENLYKQLNDKGFSCSALHGGMIQNDRLEMMKKFKRGEFKFLIATDVAARGIDIEDIKLIINYDIPLEKESYVHRIGRTGRAGKAGKAITLICPEEYKYLSQIEEYIGYKIPKIDMPTKEEIGSAQINFIKKNIIQPKLKVDRSMILSKEITKIYIGAGKKKKIRAGDIVGAIISIEGISADDIGIIDIQDNFSYIDILNNKGDLALEALQNTTIKGKTVRAQIALK